MKKNNLISIIRFFAITLFVISLTIGFINTDVSTDVKKKVPVKITIGNSNCSGSGICGIIKVNKSEFQDVSDLGPLQLYSYSFGATQSGSFFIQTSADLMSEQTYTQYFSGTNFVMENDYTIPANTIGNKKAITLKSGSYTIQRDGEQILIGLLIPG